MIFYSIDGLFMKKVGKIYKICWVTNNLKNNLNFEVIPKFKETKTDKEV